MRKTWLAVLWAAALAVCLALGALNLRFGELNQDEGWYLLAARQVGEGFLPYRDFAFTQGPVWPLVYARFVPLVRSHGIAGGRMVTAGLGLLAAVFASFVAGRALPKGFKAPAALVAFALIACNVYQSYFTTVVKTYSLAALFLVAGLFAAGFARGRGGATAAFLAGLLLALGAGVRISAGIALPVVGLYLLLERKALGNSRWIAFGLGGCAGLLLWAMPFMVAASEGFRFAMIEYHTARSAGGLVPLLVYKAGFVSRFVQAYFVAAALAAVLVVLKWIRPAARGAVADGPVPPHYNAMLWLVGLAITAVHFMAPYPYEDYQAFVFPALAAALAVSLVRQVGNLEGAGSGRWTLWLVLSVFLVSTAGAFSSPINQNWFVRGRDRIWWRLKEQAPLAQLSEVAAWVSKLSGFHPTLLTQDSYLAIEADLRVPRGMEMGPFCYFPDMERGKAERLHVLNREMMVELLETTDAPIAAFSGYGLAIQCPEVTELPEGEQTELWGIVERRYQPLCEVEGFGQGETTLKIMIRRSDAAGGAP